MKQSVSFEVLSEECAAMKRSSVFVCVSLGVALYCGVIDAGVRAAEPAADKAPASKPQAKPSTHKVKQEPFRIEVEVSGVFESAKMTELVLRPEVWTTLVVRKAVDHGKRVKKGATLVWLETAKLDEQLRSKEHELELGKLSLKDAEAGMKLLEQTVPLDLKTARKTKELADEELEYYLKVRRPRSLKEADRSLESARWRLEYAEEELKQLEKMYEADDLTEETEEIILKRARRSVESSKFSLESADISHERTINHSLPEQTERLTDTAKRQDLAWQRTKATLPISLKKKQTELEKLRRQQKKLADELAKLKKDREAMTVQSPMEGVVYYGRCRRGKWDDATKSIDRLRQGGTLTAKQPFMTVVALRPMIVRLDLAEKDLQYLRAGVQAEMTPTGFPDLRLAGRITRISSIPISSGVFDCQLRVADKKIDNRIVPGMKCNVKLLAYEKQKAIAIPSAGLHTDSDGKDYVNVVVKDGEPAKRIVVVGKRTDKKVEIRRGLKAGEEILLPKADGDGK